MSGAIAAAKEAGIDAICFGDLFLENVSARGGAVYVRE